jgi:hypothetical protein
MARVRPADILEVAEMGKSAEVWRPELLPEFEDNAAVIYVLDSAWCLSYCNAAWDRFALENGGADLLRKKQIGRSIMEVTPAPLRRFYSTLYRRALRGGQGVDHLYECSSAERSRFFRLHVNRKQTDRGSFLIAINSLVLEEAQQRRAFRDDTQALREENGLITMCCHCRRTRIPDAEDNWVWIPDLVRRMPMHVSHGICRVCFDIHYGK